MLSIWSGGGLLTLQEVKCLLSAGTHSSTMVAVLDDVFLNNDAPKEHIRRRVS